MRATWLRYLGFLGFLGLLSIVTSNPGFAGFFGAFGFFAFSPRNSDERLELNANAAARNAFLASILSFVVTLLVIVFVPSFGTVGVVYAFAASVALQFLVFSFSLVLYETKGSNAS